MALVGLLAGSLLTGATGDDDKKKKGTQADTQESVLIVDDLSEAQPRVQSTFSIGRPSSDSPIRFWVEYGLGNADQIRDTNGDNGGDPTVGGGSLIVNGDIKTQRVVAGIEISPITFNNIKVGVGAKVSGARNEVDGELANESLGALNEALGLGLTDELLVDGNLSSDFSIKNLEIFGSLRGRVLGVHAGYMLDLGDSQSFTAPVAPLGGARIPLDLPISDNRDAINFGVDFDVPSDQFRLFGGIDYYWIQEPDCSDEGGSESGDEVALMFPQFCSSSSSSESSSGENLFGEEGDGIWNFVLGGGLKFSIFEVGAAAQIAARDRQPVERNTVGTSGTTPNVGGYVSTIAPYVNISPSSLPASFYIRGELLDEYNGYGAWIGGANSVRPALGFTAGLAIGFD
ncbi:MAG: hypothetical protein AAF791_14175 [Bacteroidota bacterium]